MTDHTRTPPGTGESPRLGMWDAMSIIVGIVVGTAIYKSVGFIYYNVSSGWMALGAFALGGLLSFIGALCYAELATTYPRMGGDYVYLSRAFGRPVGFLFGWAQLAVILTGSIAAMGYAFGDYSVRLWGLEESSKVWLTGGVVVLLSLLNLAGVIFGKWVQNVLTIAKILGLLAIVVVGLGWGGADISFQPSVVPDKTNFGLAMVLVLYTFGGWSDAAFVASEVKDRSRNIPKALFYGIGAITLVYLLVNVGYLWGVGFDKMRGAPTPAADVLSDAFGENGAKVMSLLVMLSALGALNGLIFTGSRIFTALGREHTLFAALGRWDPRLNVPIWSILAQTAVASLLILTVGTTAGNEAFDWCLTTVGFDPFPWKDPRFGSEFDTLVSCTAPVFWTFFLLTGISLFVLRMKDPDLERPFRAPFYPLVPLIFCATSCYMLYSSQTFVKELSLLGWIPLAVGLPLYFISRRTNGTA
ncbi:MAG: APC family permease [Planctomycetaceae bacterium]